MNQQVGEELADALGGTLPTGTFVHVSPGSLP